MEWYYSDDEANGSDENAAHSVIPLLAPSNGNTADLFDPNYYQDNENDFGRNNFDSSSELSFRSPPDANCESSPTDVSTPSSSGSETDQSVYYPHRGYVLRREERKRRTRERNFIYRRDVNMSSAAYMSHPSGKKQTGQKKVKKTASSGSFADQLLAVIQRTFQQSWRQKSDMLLEIVIPLIFIAITIILWRIWGTEQHLVEQFVDFTALPDKMSSLEAQNAFCFKERSIPGLFNCSLRDPESYDCSGDESTFPDGISGLCYPNILNLGAAGYARYFTTLFLGTVAPVPSFDTIVLAQLVARKSSLGASDNTLVSAGLSPSTRESAIQCSGSLYIVAPTLDQAAKLENYFNSKGNLFPYIHGGSFDNVAQAEAAASAPDALTWAIIVINSMDENKLDVEIRINSKALPKMGKAKNPHYSGGFQFDQAELYAVSGFLTLQQIVSDHYMNTVLKANNALTHFTVAMGGAPYKQAPLLTYALDLIPLIYAMAFLYPVSQLTKKIVLEKELKLREAMLIMGLTNLPLYLSWFILYLLEYFVTSLVITILLKLTYVTQSDPFIMFLIFFLFALTTIPLSGLMAAFFSKARLASLLAPIIYFVLAIPLFAMQNAQGIVIMIFSLLSPTALAQATSILLSHELSGGFARNEFFNPIDNPCMFLTLMMLVGDLIIYYVLMLYLDAVMPKDWGTPKHPLFFIIDPVTWCFGGAKRLEGGTDGRDEDGVFEEINYDESAVVLDGLRKEFSRGGKKFVAVDNLYWGMDEGEVSVLLGHNGAGKSTTLNMMTGMLEPDAGDCYAYGLSVRQQLSRVRQEIGFCPQHNILWPELTCREHLEFYAKIKGLKGWALEDAVCRMLHETDLAEKIDSQSNALSGGQKRKLSVAIAFVGRSRLVFLDEPTAGMDVGARRYTWELLRRMSEAHTILLTTHYMDEADLLGHRIGIMSQGRLKCSGSSLFLKSRLGVGYSIAIAVDPMVDIYELDQVVLSLIGGSEILGHNGCEVSYRLPKDELDAFPALLDAIEAQGAELGVRGYSLSATTLEEIFLRVSEEDILHGESDLNRKATANNDIVWNCAFLSSDKAVWWQQLKTMMKKRLFNALRDRRMQCFQVVCPVVCVLLAMLLNLIKYSVDGGTQLLLSNSIYPEQAQVDLNRCDAYFGKSISALAGAKVVNHNYVNINSISLMLLDNWNNHASLQVGAIGCDDVDMTRRSCVLSPTVQLYNSSVPHQAGINMASFYEGVYKRIVGSSGSYKVAVGTLPELGKGESPQQVLNLIMMGAIIMIPFTFLPSNPVAWVVKERECRARHLQSLCGLSFYVYWASNFIFDIAAYILTVILVIIIFLVFQRTEYIGLNRIVPTIVLFVVYGLTSTVVAYATSFAFKEHSMAQMVVMAISFVTGFLLVMVVYILSLLEKTKDTSNSLRWPFRLIPSYCIGEGIINLATLTQQQQMGEDLTPWSMNTIGWPLLYMSAEFPVFILLTLLIDHPGLRVCFQSVSYKRNGVSEEAAAEDSDVEAEADAARREEVSTLASIVLVVDLRKKYANGKVAVKNLTFGIMPGEVFGFLGTNGAGKTTTISILCQEFLPTSGRAYVCGYDIVQNSREALQCIGYCPQFDATLDLLTVEEHLYMYAGIRGIVPDQHDDIVVSLMRLCGLMEYRETLSGELSGGNRRKLNFAVSLVGGPPVVFLDEPSAGMDPVARRGLWSAIQRASGNCSVVLTTHHLEEVEALADTVAIMVDGTLRCIGDKTHLKTKYGSGFEMSLRIDSAQFKEDVEQFVRRCFPNATLNEYRSQRFVYALPIGTSLADVFQLIQEYKDDLGITDYSVSQTSIEQVFLRISGEGGVI